jgi:hypothetical protein
MARRYWTCRKCKHRNERSSSRKCAGCLELTKPKLRVPKHAETLRDDPYEVYEELSARIHGTEPGACGCCRRERVETRRHDRDHDHFTGKPRGLACTRCNKELLRNATLESARAVVAYLERVEARYATAGAS